MNAMNDTPDVPSYWETATPTPPRKKPVVLIVIAILAIVLLAAVTVLWALQRNDLHNTQDTLDTRTDQRDVARVSLHETETELSNSEDEVSELSTANSELASQVATCALSTESARSYVSALRHSLDAAGNATDGYYLLAIDDLNLAMADAKDVRRLATDNGYSSINAMWNACAFAGTSI